MANLSFDTPIQSSDQSFDRVLKAGIPVATVFWSGSLGSDLEAQMKALAKAESLAEEARKAEKARKAEEARAIFLRLNSTLELARTEALLQDARS